MSFMNLNTNQQSPTSLILLKFAYKNQSWKISSQFENIFNSKYYNEINNIISDFNELFSESNNS